jgi:hypothetical protein
VELTREDYVRLTPGREKSCTPESIRDVSASRRFANTDINGKFTFTNIVPGRYYLSAEREGFLRVNFGQRGRFSPGTPLRIGAQPDEVFVTSNADAPPDVANPFSEAFQTRTGVVPNSRGTLPPGLGGNISQTGQRGGLDRDSERLPDGAGAPSVIGAGAALTGTSRTMLQDLAIAMTPASAIVGTVFTDRSTPAPAASVQAYQFRYSPMNGKTLKAVRTTVTGEGGDYRLMWLNPGRRGRITHSIRSAAMAAPAVSDAKPA